MSINATIYGNIALFLAIATTLILYLRYKGTEKSPSLTLNFFLNLIQPIGIIYFFIKLKKK